MVTIEKYQSLIKSISEKLVRLVDNHYLENEGVKKIICSPLGYNVLCRILDYWKQNSRRDQLFLISSIPSVYDEIEILGFSLPIEIRYKAHQYYIGVQFGDFERGIDDSFIEVKELLEHYKFKEDDN